MHCLIEDNSRTIVNRDDAVVSRYYMSWHGYKATASSLLLRNYSVNGDSWSTCKMGKLCISQIASRANRQTAFLPSQALYCDPHSWLGWPLSRNAVIPARFPSFWIRQDLFQDRNTAAACISCNATILILSTAFRRRWGVPTIPG